MGELGRPRGVPMGELGRARAVDCGRALAVRSCDGCLVEAPFAGARPSPPASAPTGGSSAGMPMPNPGAWLLGMRQRV